MLIGWYSKIMLNKCPKMFEEIAKSCSAITLKVLWTSELLHFNPSRIASRVWNGTFEFCGAHQEFFCRKKSGNFVHHSVSVHLPRYPRAPGPQGPRAPAPYHACKLSASWSTEPRQACPVAPGSGKHSAVSNTAAHGKIRQVLRQALRHCRDIPRHTLTYCEPYKPCELCPQTSSLQCWASLASSQWAVFPHFARLLPCNRLKVPLATYTSLLKRLQQAL